MKKRKLNVKLDRTYEKQITVFKKPLKLKRVMLICIVGTVLGLTGFFEIKAFFWALFACINASILIFCFVLQNNSILYFKEKSLEVTPSGDLFITKLEGICPICKASLKVKKNNSQAYIICKENEKHIWDVN